jgi:LmbE family N-acetylglucosaminyl deacetylase
MATVRPAARDLPSVARAARRRARELRERRLRPRLEVSIEAPELLLSPHWDDAVLDCWGPLCGEPELNVVNVFAGVPAAGRLAAWDAITGAGDSATRARERIAEDALALQRAGRRPQNLPFLDAQYRPPPRAPSLAELDAALAAAVPSAARIYAPAGIGGHPDHVLVRRYACALRRVGMPVTLYAELPYCVLHGWPHWVDGAEPDPHRDVDEFWRTFLDAVPGLPPLRGAHVRRLDETAAAAKLAAMRCYRTQFSCLDFGAGRLLSDPEIHRYEVSWDLGA